MTIWTYHTLINMKIEDVDFEDLISKLGIYKDNDGLNKYSLQSLAKHFGDGSDGIFGEIITALLELGYHMDLKWQDNILDNNWASRTVDGWWFNNILKNKGTNK